MAIAHVPVSDDHIADFCRRWTIREMPVFESIVCAEPYRRAAILGSTQLVYAA